MTRDQAGGGSREAAEFRPLIVIPAWNEAATIGSVIGEVRTHLDTWDVLVVSDGSTDGTAAAARALGLAVVDLPFNLGVGGAMRAGFSYAERYGYTHALQLDADGQHDPREVGKLEARWRETGADIVIGARFAGSGDYTVKGPRKWAMKLLSAVLSRVCRTKLTDTTSGFKLIGPRGLTLFSANYPAEYLGDTVEALVMAARAGLKVEQVAVTMRERAGGTPSHSPIKAAVFLGRAFMALGVALTRPQAEIRGERA